MGVNGIYGLSGSGLDIESMVKVGMMGKQNEYDKLQQKYTKNEWVKAAYIETYGTIQTFNNSTLSKYKMSNNMNAKSAVSSQESVVTATANANAANMTHVVEVGQLASAAYLVGTESLKRVGKDAEQSIALKDVLFYSLKKDDEGLKYYKNESETVKDDEGNDNGHLISATDTAFAFTLNDGINGMMGNTNSEVVTVTASSDVSVGKYYKVEIDEVATRAHITSESIDDIGEAASLSEYFLKQYNSAYHGSGPNSVVDYETLEDITASYKADLLSEGKSLQATAITLNFRDSDPYKNAGTDVKISYADLLDPTKTIDSLFDDIKKQLADSNIEFDYKHKYFGLQYSLTQKKSGSDNIINVSFNFADTGDRGIGKFVDSLFASPLQDTNIDTDTNAILPSSSDSIKIGGKNAQGYVIETDKDHNVLADAKRIDLEFESNGVARPSGMNMAFIAHDVGESFINTVEPTMISVTYQQLFDGYTFNDLVSSINSAGTNVKAIYDSVQDKFSFYNKESGEKHQIGFNFDSDSDDANKRALDLFRNMGLQKSIDGELSGENVKFYNEYDSDDNEIGATVVVTGQDAKVKIDGIDMSVDSNQVNVAGVVYKFTGTNATIDDDGKVQSLDNKAQVVVSQDTNEVVDNVKAFIEDYNKLLSTLQDLYNEKPYTTYKPLTDAQRAEMTDDQIEKWEEKARSGMLYHDRTLGKVIDQIRETVSQTVYGIDGKYNNIYSIGISTTGTKGQLTLDEDKLRAALSADPDAVYNIFARLDEGEKVFFKPPQYNSDGTEKYTLKERPAYNGIAQRLGDILNAGMKSIKTRAGTSSDISEDSDLNNLLRELQTKMSNFRTMMNAFEDALYKKYDKMEVALSTLGAQLNFVTSSFSS